MGRGLRRRPEGAPGDRRRRARDGAGLASGGRLIRDLPTGSPNFLFTDIEGSTELWERHPRTMGDAIERHDGILRAAIEGREGRVFKTVGDAFHAVFADAAEALAAALDAQRGLRGAEWPIPEPPAVRMAVHAGAAELRGDDYFGPPLNRVARILSAGHGGQILLSREIERRVGDRFPEGAALRDLGDRRLKDLYDPERIYQLVVPDLPADFPPLKTLDARPHNLPALTTPLVGRHREVEEVRRLLEGSGVRLVTLLGPGGTGKTRLALQVAADSIDRFEDGVWLVNLAPTHDPALVAGEILRVLGGRPDGEESEADALLRHVARKEVLVVIDNFEQVVDAAPLVERVLESGPRVVSLVTSQAALRVRAEHVFEVPPLAVPEPGTNGDPGRIEGNDCVSLFVDRARASVPAFELTAENAAAVAAICREVDGLPLAIELAAARVKLMTPRAILERLQGNYDFLASRGRDVPDRHRAVRKAIDWSYELLDEDERAFFRRQSVFDGGFTLEAAEGVCSEPDDPLDVFETLESLVDKSLVRRVEQGGETRFERLRTIRAYAVEKLEESGEADRWRNRHAEWFAERARHLDVDRAGETEAAQWLRWLESEIENVRAAFRWAVEHGRADLAVRFCRVLPALWFLKGHTEEARGWLGRTLELGDALTPVQRATVLNLQGRVDQWMGDNSPAVMARFEESLRLYQEAGHRRGTSRAHMNIGNVHRRLGQLDAAAERFETALATYRELDDAFGEVNALMNLGDLASARRDGTTARRRFEEARSVAERWGMTISRAYALQYLGEMALVEGDLDRAQSLIEDGRDGFDAVGSEVGMAWSHYYLAMLAWRRGELGEARSRLAQALTVFRRMDLPPGVAACLLAQATVAAEEGRHETAARLLGAGRAIHDRARISAGPMEEAMVERAQSLCREGLGEEACSRLEAEGRAAPVEEAVALAAGTDA
ncbi:MAG TPA: tetratricopeptide repeat protein [Gemmatimonadota bacterium]|nr:tetratricopeptide repeat protein [Gemmatimonadota bacterium]